MKRAIGVWDPLVRLTHWALALSFAVAYATAEEAPRAHEIAGYIALGLVVVRVAWGCVGPQHARFRDFLRGPRAVLVYVLDVARQRERRYLGHNPVGAWMIVALWAGFVLLATTGHIMTHGSALPPEWLEELHEAVGSGMLALIAVHVLGVLYASVRHRENLALSMLTGRKRPTDGPAGT